MEQKTHREHIMAEAKTGLMPKTGLMEGKRGLVMGVANDHSIAWGIAQMLAAHGAEIAFTYQGDAQKKRLTPLAQSIGSSIVIPADVESDEQLDAAFALLKKEWGTLDFLVHAIAFSDREELKGRYVDTSRANFTKSLDISCYSFTAVAQRAASLMRTLAGAAVGDARMVFKWNKSHSPLKRTVDLNHVGGAALYLLSDLAGGVTGEVHFVDAGFNVIGMPPTADLKGWTPQDQEQPDGRADSS